MTIEEYNKGVDEWADDAYRFARSCSCDDNKCRDAVQEAFAKLWERRKSVQIERGEGLFAQHGPQLSGESFPL